MRSFIAHIGPEFKVCRMVVRYAWDSYLVVCRRNQRWHRELVARAKDFSGWRHGQKASRVPLPIESLLAKLAVVAIGEELIVSDRIFLDSLTADDVIAASLEGYVEREEKSKSQRRR